MLPASMEDKILKLLGRSDYAPLNSSEMVAKLGMTTSQLPELQRVLARLERGGRIARVKGDRFALPSDADLVPGRIRMNRQGAGTLQPNDPTLPAIRIPHEATATALHGDHVLVR